MDLKRYTCSGQESLLEDESTYELYVVTANHVTPSDTYENKNGEIFKVVEAGMEVESGSESYRKR